MSATQASSIERQAAIAGEQLPDDIVNRPTLGVGLQFYLSAFYDLGTERALGVSPGPIPWRAKLEYARYYQLDPLETERFFSIIDRLDADYLQSVKPKESKNGRPSKTGRKP